MQQETIENIRSGDLDAYEQVVRQYRGMLLGYVVDGMDPGTYRRPFRKHTVKLTKDVRVDSFLLQYTPVHDDDVVTLSSDRRVLQVSLNVKNGVDQIRVLVAADRNER